MPNTQTTNWYLSSKVNLQQKINLQQQNMLNNSNEKYQISRYDLKKQLEGIQSFDISSFAQSKNESHNNLKAFTLPKDALNNDQALFPNIDAPTLELLEDSQYNIRYLDIGTKEAHKINNNHQKGKKKAQQKQQSDQYYEDLTARNNQSQNVYQYEQKIQEITKELEKSLQRLERQKKQNQLLHQKITLMEQHEKKIVDDFKEKLKQQREQIKNLKQREIKSTREKQMLQKQLSETISKNGSQRQSRIGELSAGGYSTSSNSLLTNSYIDEKSYFYPQLLSPQQTVTLLSKLLKKVSKSSKMIKQLTDDQGIKKILAKMQKK